MSRKFKWGIIGLGNISHKFAQAVMALDDAELFAVGSRSLDKAKHFAGKYKVAHAFGSYEELVQSKLVDAVYIPTPHVYHCKDTLMCLEEKIPVLCEKPLAINYGEVKQITDTSREQNTFLMEAMWTRFLPSIKKTENIIRKGELGDVKMLQADFCFKAPYDPEGRLFNKTLGGGAVLDIGVYPLFLSLLLLGKPVNIETVATFGHTNVDESCGIVLKHNKGAVSSLSCSIVTGSATEAQICCDKGRIRIPGRWFTPSCIEIIDNNNKLTTIDCQVKANGYEYEIMEAMNCIREGRIESELMSHQFSLDLMELMDTVRKKAGILYENHD